MPPMPPIPPTFPCHWLLLLLFQLALLPPHPALLFPQPLLPPQALLGGLLTPQLFAQLLLLLFPQLLLLLFPQLLLFAVFGFTKPKVPLLLLLLLLLLYIDPQTLLPP